MSTDSRLLDSLLRANPRYEIVLRDRLVARELAAFGASGADSEVFALLRPRPAVDLPPRAIDRDTALLLLVLAQPCTLPSYVQSEHGGATSAIVRRLLADQALEIELDGAFKSGPAALAELCGEAISHRIGELSRQALRYGSALALVDPEEVALRLYAFHRLPLTARWRRTLGSPSAVEGFLRIEPGGANQSAARLWHPRREHGGWWFWRSRRAAGSTVCRYKLYLSPRPEALPDCFGDALEALAEDADSLKMATGPTGLLRPDKLVAHFPSLESLAKASTRLTDRLAGTKAHGVPFTAEVTADGLLSWAIDPPVMERSRLGGEAESWRLFVTRELAQGLLAGRASSPPSDPGEFALRRLAAHGVDPSTWLPSGERRLEQRSA